MTYIDTIKPRREESWYDQSGNPVYDVDLRDARKQTLFPRVTSILSLWPKPELSAWKDEQLVLAALTLPRIENEPTDAFAKRVVADSKKHTEATADWGTRFHAQADGIITGKRLEPDPDPLLNECVEFFHAWAMGNVLGVVATEQTIVNPVYGYAGRMDWLLNMQGGRTLCDCKSRSVKNGKPVFYKEQAMQLAAYGRCLPCPAKQDGVLNPETMIPSAEKYMSVIVNRDKAELPYVKVWSTDEIELAWKRFRAIFQVWQLDRNYYPTGVSWMNA